MGALFIPTVPRLRTPWSWTMRRTGPWLGKSVANNSFLDRILLRHSHFITFNIISGAHYMNTNTRSCPPGFSKYTRSLRRRAQELSNDIWHSYIDQHRHAVHRWKALELYFSMLISVKTWNSCPPDFWQWAPLRKSKRYTGHWSSIFFKIYRTST